LFDKEYKIKREATWLSAGMKHARIRIGVIRERHHTNPRVELHICAIKKRLCCSGIRKQLP
jgi:hypothetical protein